MGQHFLTAIFQRGEPVFRDGFWLYPNGYRLQMDWALLDSGDLSIACDFTGSVKLGKQTRELESHPIYLRASLRRQIDGTLGIASISEIPGK